MNTSAPTSATSNFGSGLEVGLGRAALGPTVLETGMMGWGMLHNVARGSATPLHARAFVMREGKTLVAMVCLETAFISIEVKRRVLKKVAAAHPELGVGQANLLLCATHTHSGPGGFTHYPFYNITIPGFVADNAETIAQAAFEALDIALVALAPGRARFGGGAFESTSHVAFNRSVASYNRNVDVESLPLDANTLALDRRMRLLQFEDESGDALGSINWFAVHCTSVHSDNTMMHFDNKGYAAQFLEGARGDGYVGAFAQGAAGDVTPNYKSYPQKPWVRGAALDDDESAQINGRLQFEQALAIEDKLADTSDPSLRDLSFAHAFVDFSQVEVAPQHAGGEPGRRTGPAEIGWAMLFGTEEGPGIDRRLLFTQALVQRARTRMRKAGRQAIQGEKVTVIESGRRKIMGLSRFGRFRAPGRLSPALAQLLALDQSKRADAKPWTPQILPVQLLRVGDIAIAAVPAEFTTTAGRRLRASVKAALAREGKPVREVVLCGYANAYAGYVTTPEEYQVQDYEGASTLFGTWTLGAYQSEFDKLAARMGKDLGPEHGPQPPTFTEADLEGRVYEGVA